MSSYWNYRLATKIDNNERLFSIIEVYYDGEKGKGIPNGYTTPNILSNWESVIDLNLTHKLVNKAFKRPIIDLDHFPNEYEL
jgi:hypothetical protein